MPALASTELYRRIKPVNIQPVLAVIDKLQFIDTKGVCAWVTAPGVAAPQPMIEMLESLELGGLSYRCFCRKLLAGQGIDPHVDDHHWMAVGIRRFHVPLVTHPDTIMVWPDDDASVHLAPGYLWEVRYDRTHAVVNDTAQERIHVQIDQVGATI